MPAESVRPPEPDGPPGTGLSEFQRSFNPRDVTAEDLDGYVDGLRHDKILWIGVTSDPTKNDENGVKVVVKIRGARWNTRLGADKYHKAKGWLKTIFFKTRSALLSHCFDFQHSIRHLIQMLLCSRLSPESSQTRT